MRTCRRIRTTAHTTSLAVATVVGSSLLQAQGAATHSTAVWDAVFARDETSIATVARGEARIWSLPSGQLACRLDGNFYAARIGTDGESGYHITLVSASTGGSNERVLRAFRIDPITCAQTPATVVAGATGGFSPVQYVVRAPDGRVLQNGFATSPDSRLVIRPEGRGYIVQTPDGARLESETVPNALEAGSTTYTCTLSDRKVTYSKVTGTRIEKIGEVKVDSYGAGGCGALALSRDSTMMFSNGGAVIDLRRKKVLVSMPGTQITSVGADVAAGRAAIGGSSGVRVTDLGSGKETFTAGGGGIRSGYASPTTLWFAVASDLISRPQVRLQSNRLPNVTLDDARSRPAADVMVANREREVRERAEAIARSRVAEAAEGARLSAAFDARVDSLRRVITRRFGPVSVYATLRQIQYQGAYDWIFVNLRKGDIVALASDGDGIITFSVSDGLRRVSTERNTNQPTTGFMVSAAEIVADISGNLLVRGSGGLVHVFIVPKGGR